VKRSWSTCRQLQRDLAWESCWLYLKVSLQCYCFIIIPIPSRQLLCAVSSCSWQQPRHPQGRSGAGGVNRTSSSGAAAFFAETCKSCFELKKSSFPGPVLTCTSLLLSVLTSLRNALVCCRSEDASETNSGIRELQHRFALVSWQLISHTIA